ncbi:hypothetical protein OIU77_029607 [Salix suchowensis]|uniref:Uncharacterized protein n=1 Tax=Salix suchowensis TaxID=1278906 RepID=A0ABQ9BB61_9ROSI|nr:hypothetical protein OIU77_029607 [Salix suchowensis]
MMRNPAIGVLINFVSWLFLVVSPGGSDGLGGSSGGGGGGGQGGGASGGAGSGGNRKWSFLSWYLNLLAKYPVLTKAVTSAILTLMGDLICQMCLEVFVNYIDCHSFDYIERVAFALYSDQWMHYELKLLV